MARADACRKAAYARAAKLSPERRREIARMGGLARMAKHPIAAMSRLGGLAMVERLGRAGLAEQVAKWRRRNPSALVQAVTDWLGDLGLERKRDYELDREVDGWYGDAVFKGKRLIVEVNGHAWHHEDWHGEGVRRAERDAAKLATWAAKRRRVLVLEEWEIRDGSGRERLRAFLSRGGGEDERA